MSHGFHIYHLHPYHQSKSQDLKLNQRNKKMLLEVVSQNYREEARHRNIITVTGLKTKQKFQLPTSNISQLFLSKNHYVRMSLTSFRKHNPICHWKMLLQFFKYINEFNLSPGLGIKIHMIEFCEFCQFS